ncbi:hypothetical protein EDD86DRAFT_185922 [Gorgonomyces haynaldii]|nr:hypothetical protein EDD86DRAFT_185922 [Gorgonomyces haynaldii]
MVVEEEEEEEKKEKPLLPFVETIATNEFDPVVLEEWEDKIVWDVAQGDKRSNDFIPTFNKTTMFRNTHLELDDWMDAIVWDAEKEYQPVNFHMDDPKLVILQDEVDDIVNPKPESMRVSMYKKRPDGKVIDRFNISDDWLYEIVKTKISRMRHAFGPATLVHSLPATMLHTQYFKPLLHVRELRSHHRPSVKFPLKEWYTFSRVKQIKKKKLKEIDPAELMKSPKDVSLKDTAKFCLVEYSEEYPPIMQNTGMASLIYNYYRKKDEKDSFVPKLANGGPIILESVDASPFFGYGDVKPGQTIQVIFNNLFRAPIFEQNKSQTDFLLIRQTYRGETKYYLRDIPNTYIVGQTYPVQEVPRPQARKITQSLKNRLQVVAFRLMRDDTYKRLRYDKLRKMFPMFNDMQIRQKLKEFAQYLKKGENTGWWKLKPNVQLPDEEGIRKIITPEQVCLIQSTLVGQQRLKDAGYAAEDYKENENEEDESHLDIEVQLAPWTTTRNFVTAASGKGMCRLFGPGDPTGCGEGFSFIRASMKEMFFRYGESEEKQKQFIEEKTKATYHKYSIAEQQVVYKSEVERIWNNQLRGLSAKTVDEKDRELDSARHEKQRREKEEEKDRQRNMGGSLAPYSPPNVQNDTYSDDEQENYTQKNKMLVITRLQKNSNGEMEWVSEVIYDMRVINAYTRYRKLIEQAAEEYLN